MRIRSSPDYRIGKAFFRVSFETVSRFFRKRCVTIEFIPRGEAEWRPDPRCGKWRPDPSSVAVALEGLEERLDGDRLLNVTVGFEPRRVPVAVVHSGQDDDGDPRELRVLTLHVAELP